MASTTITRPVIHHSVRRGARPLDVEAIVTELLLHEDDADEFALEEYALCRVIEAQGIIGRDPEVGMWA